MVHFFMHKKKESGNVAAPFEIMHSNRPRGVVASIRFDDGHGPQSYAFGGHPAFSCHALRIPATGGPAGARPLAISRGDVVREPCTAVREKTFAGPMAVGKRP